MNIFFLILKIIGIILLVILGLLLTILMLILFVPFRYKIYGDKKDKEIKAKITLSYLLHFVHASIKFYENKLILTFRVFGIPLKKMDLLSKEKKVTNNKSAKKSADDSYKESDTVKDKTKENKINTSDNDDIPQTLIEDVDYKIETFEEEEKNNINDNYQKESIKNSNYNKIDEEAIDDAINNEEDNIPKKNKILVLIDKIKAFFNSLYNQVVKLINTIEDFINNTESSIEKFENEFNFYSKFISDERNQEAIKHCLNEVKRIFRSIRPRVINGNIIFGFDDPGTTGQIFSYLCILNSLMYNKISFVPDFENEILEGQVNIKGHITLFVFLIVAWRIYFNKNIKRLLRIYKKHKNKVK